MSTETNTAKICDELVRYSGTVHGGAARAMWAAKVALDSQAQQMAELRGMLDEYKKECEACFAIAQRLDAGNSAMPSSFTGVPSERIARQIEALTTSLTLASGCLYRAGWEYIPDAIHGPVWKPPVNRIAAEMRVRLAEKDVEIAALTAERDELRKRLDDAKPATPAPGEWVEWLGGECPIADGARIDAKCRDGDVLRDCIPSNLYWAQLTGGNYWGDIVAYRVRP